MNPNLKFWGKKQKFKLVGGFNPSESSPSRGEYKKYRKIFETTIPSPLGYIHGTSNSGRAKPLPRSSCRAAEAVPGPSFSSASPRRRKKDEVARFLQLGFI